ncbi:MAG: hypothetical protein ACLS48_11495 [[Eubacterium] siraeum]
MCEIEQAGYLTPETVFVDGTHIKANANMKKRLKLFRRRLKYTKKRWKKSMKTVKNGKNVDDANRRRNR